MNKIYKNLSGGLMAMGLLWNSSTIPFWSDVSNLQNEVIKLIIPATKMTVIATGYSSTVSQTDDTPFITASNKRVYDGLIAANFLEFGTEVLIPELYGEKAFTVNDRMHSRFNNYKTKRVDIWFSTLTEAKKFGVKTIEIEIINKIKIPLPLAMGVVEL